MFGEESFPNPVSPEDVVSIPKENNSLAEKAKVSDAKISPEATAGFDEFSSKEIKENKTEGKSYPENLLLVERYDDDTITRTFYRYDEKGENVEYSIQNLLALWNDGDWSIRKHDVSPSIERGTFWTSGANHAQELAKTRGTLMLEQVLDDQNMRVFYDEKGRFRRVRFRDIVGSDLVISPDENRQTPIPEVDNQGLIKLSINLRPDGTVSVDVRANPSRKLGQVDEIEVEGRKMQAVNTTDELKLIFHNKDNPEKIDYEITIPKQQEVVDFETGDLNATGPEKRFAFEQDLIPEPLRENLTLPPNGLDDAWKRADLLETLVIKIDKNLAV